MVFLILLFFVIFSRPVFAAPTVNITLSPTTAVSGATIPIQFTIENSDPETSYHYKIFGGIGSSETQIQTNETLNYNSLWDSFPTVTIDSTGRKVVDTTAYIKSDNFSGSYNLYVRITKSDTHTPTPLYTSSASVITITGPTPTPTSAPTATPTSDPTVTNPTSGISLTEFMPYSSIEWIEIYNSNDYPVKLVSWKIGDNSSTTKNFDLNINAKSYATFDFSNFLNNDGDKVTLINNSGQTISQREYGNNNYTLDYSWSLVSGSWCRAAITKGSSNASSCYSAPSNTPTPAVTITPTKTLTITPTPDQGKYTPDESATASAIVDPLNEATYLSPTSVPTTAISQSPVLGQNTTAPKTKKKYLPLIFILLGGCLLVSPLIINKIKKK